MSKSHVEKVPGRSAEHRSFLLFGLALLEALKARKHPLTLGKVGKVGDLTALPNIIATSSRHCQGCELIDDLLRGIP